MKKHIVIIDNNRQLRESLEIILTVKGYRVTAMSAVKTVEELIDLGADCFIIEEHLPLITGHIICMILSAKPQTKDIPVILTGTSNDLKSYADLCDAKAYLNKPYLFAHILETVHGILPDEQVKAA